MEFKDYYDVMGVKRDATQDQIKRAYRKLSRKYHPDVSKVADAEARFKEVGEAYAVLKDPEKRSAYNQLGKDFKAGQDFNPPPNWDAGFEHSGRGSGGRGPGGAEAQDYSDFFSSLFGQGFRPSDGGRSQAGFQSRGEDHHAKVMINIKDAYNGTTRSISLRSPQVDSSGHLVNRERTLNVKIPKGVKQGQQIRLSGQGSPGLGEGQAGDLYLEVEFESHPVFTVEGRDVSMTLPITPWEAALGASVEVVTPAGAVKLTIAAGTTSGRKLRLKGRGIPGKPPGDLYVIAQITVPPADSDKAKELYRKMEQELPYDPRSTLGV